MTKSDIKLIDDSLRKGKTPKELVLFKGGENTILKEKLEQFGAVNMNFANFLKYLEFSRMRICNG